MNRAYISILNAVADRRNRIDAAKELARLLEVNDVIVFVEESDLEIYLPAPGFPQTLPNGQAWQAFLSSCRAADRASTVLISPFTGEPAEVLGIRAEGGAILALLGGRPRLDIASELIVLFPILAVLLQNERTTVVAEGQLATVRDFAETAQTLALTLDEMRTTLQRAIHDRDHAIETMRQADRRKDEFLAVLSHELRSPLNVIIGHAELLHLETPGSPDFFESLDAIERNTRLQAQLVNDLLDVSRIITGKFALDIRSFELTPVISAALDSVRFAAKAKGVHLEVECEPSLTSFVADEGRLLQVLWNLLTNSVRFTPAGGCVKLHARRVGRNVEFCVEDTGEGIDQDFLPHVFDRFLQENASKSRRYGGLGLGLSIVRHIAELHGGFVKADSQGKGRGAIFTLTLPDRQVANSQEREAIDGMSELDEHTKKASKDEPSRPPSLAGLRVKVIDDLADVRTLLHRSLTHLGAEVATADSGEAGLALMASSPTDVIVCDIGMPDMDGYKMIGRWRAIERQEGRQAVPAVALTAYAAQVDEEKALAAGFQSHMAKPLNISQLANKLAELSGRNFPFMHDAQHTWEASENAEN